MYLFYMSTYESLESLSMDKSLKHYYSSKAREYKDSIVSQFPDNVTIKSESLVVEGDYKSALEMLLKSMNPFPPRLSKPVLSLSPSLISTSR